MLQHPLQIISLILSATERGWALGLEACRVGRSHECNLLPAVTALPACTVSQGEVEAALAPLTHSPPRLISLSPSRLSFDYGYRGRGWQPLAAE